MKYWQSEFNSRIKISQQQLLSVSQKISKEYTLNVPSALTKLVILPVDPFHLYAYWKLGENNFQSAEHIQLWSLTLRVYCHCSKILDLQNTLNWFDVSVTRDQDQRQIEVPHDDKFYSGVIGRHFPDSKFVPDVYSNVIHIPRSGVASNPEINEENTESAKQPVLDELQTEDTQTRSVNEVIENFTIKDNLFAESKKAAFKTKPIELISSNKNISRWSSGYGIGQK